MDPQPTSSLKDGEFSSTPSQASHCPLRPLAEPSPPFVGVCAQVRQETNALRTVARTFCERLILAMFNTGSHETQYFSF